MVRREKIPEFTFLQVFSVLLFQVRCWSISTPSILHCLACLTDLLPVETLGCLLEICVNIGLEPISINSVFATFRLKAIS